MELVDIPGFLSHIVKASAIARAGERVKYKCVARFVQKKAGNNIKCDITTSWRTTQPGKVMKKARASWPCGPVVCKTNINLARDNLIKATAKAKFQLELKFIPSPVWFKAKKNRQISSSALH